MSNYNVGTFQINENTNFKSLKSSYGENISVTPYEEEKEERSQGDGVVENTSEYVSIDDVS